MVGLGFTSDWFIPSQGHSGEEFLPGTSIWTAHCLRLPSGRPHSALSFPILIYGHILLTPLEQQGEISPLRRECCFPSERKRENLFLVYSRDLLGVQQNLLSLK